MAGGLTPNKRGHFWDPGGKGQPGPLVDYTLWEQKDNFQQLSGDRGRCLSKRKTIVHQIVMDSWMSPGKTAVEETLVSCECATGKKRKGTGRG